MSNLSRLRNQDDSTSTPYLEVRQESEVRMKKFDKLVRSFIHFEEMESYIKVHPDERQDIYRSLEELFNKEEDRMMKMGIWDWTKDVLESDSPNLVQHFVTESMCHYGREFFFENVRMNIDGIRIED